MTNISQDLTAYFAKLWYNQNDIMCHDAHCKEERYVIKKQYQDVMLEIVLVLDDTVRCSQWGQFGDDGDDDIFN